MSSRPKGKNTATATQPRGQTRKALSLTTSRQMLPLVTQILTDIQARWNRLSQLEAEQADLEHRRRALSWPERSRRYQITDEIAGEQHRLQEATAELESLLVVLVDPLQGEAAFPTIINGRKSYFVWKLGDADLNWWCYANDPTRRPVPPTWRKEG